MQVACFPLGTVLDFLLSLLQFCALVLHLEVVQILFLLPEEIWKLRRQILSRKN